MAFHSNEPRIIARPYVLYDGYAPETLLGRAREQQELYTQLAPAARREKPFHCWLYGPSGSGKTTTARTVVAALEKQRWIRPAYVNCWSNPSCHAALDALCHEFRVLGAEARSVTHKLNKLKAAFGKDMVVLILDEIDRLPLRERNDLLYSWAETSNVGLVVISYRRDIFLQLDKRVRSRLNPLLVAFKAYSPDEVAKILQSRALEGLLPSAWDDAIITEIAALSEGNARLALQTLREAAYLAEQSKADKLQSKHVAGVRQRVQEANLSYRLKALTDHHRLLVELARARPGIVSAELWDAYRERCATGGWEPVAHRTYLSYLSKLLRLGLLRERVVARKSRTRAFFDATPGPAPGV